MRTILSFAADSPYVMYLDDDDWLKPEHCRLMYQAIQGKDWAFSLSIYADGNKEVGLCTDLLESVGVNKGIYAESEGGFVRPSALILDKTKLSHILHLWSDSPSPNGDAEDRLIFKQIKHLPHGETGQATVFCALDPCDGMHKQRLAFIEQQGEKFVSVDKVGSVREQKSKLSILWRRIKNKIRKKKRH